jgi:hypothetical protein
MTKSVPMNDILFTTKIKDIVFGILNVKYVQSSTIGRFNEVTGKPNFSILICGEVGFLIMEIS